MESLPLKELDSLPLKELDFGLQKPTGPSSGVVASIVLVIEVQYVELDFHELDFFPPKIVKKKYPIFNTQFLY